MKSVPPKIAEWILLSTAYNDDRQALAGDIAEMYQHVALDKGIVNAYLWYWLQVLVSLPPLISYSIIWSVIMFKSYLKTALRTIAKQKVFSTINVLGLSTGIACSILIYLYITHELSYDKFHENGDSVYAVVCYDDFHGYSGLWTPITMPEGMKAEFPEIDRAFVIHNLVTAVVQYGDNLFNEKPMFTETEFLKQFTFPLKYGSVENALPDDNSVVITEKIAEKYFGDADPVGKTLSFTFDNFAKDYTVTAVAFDVPDNSSIRFDFLLTKENLRFIKPEGYLENWRWKDSKTFVTLKSGAVPETVNERFPQFVKEYFAERIERHRASGGEGDVYTFTLKKFNTVHLDNSLSGITTHDLNTSYILSGIGFLILIVACINFINLSVGSAAYRAVEIGVRKVMGAQRQQLIRQFWCESFLLAAFSMLAGIMLVVLLLPVFNTIADKNFEPGDLLSFTNIAGVLLLTLLVGTMAGGFPGIVLSGMKPVEILKGKLYSGTKNRFMNSLVVLQFAGSVFLIISSLVMTGQLNHMRKLDTGFNPDGVIAIQTQESSWVDGGPKTIKLVERFREKVSMYPEVESLSASTSSFNRFLAASHFMIEGEERDVIFNRIYYEYLSTMKIDLLEGREFSRDFPSDSTAVLINRKFIQEYNIENPVGYTFVENGWEKKTLHVIGVIDNYNFEDLSHEIKPMVLTLTPGYTLKHILVRINGNNIAETLDKLEAAWQEVEPDRPFMYSFVDEDLEASFRVQEKWNAIVLYASLLAIAISCMGIFGLSIIVINKRIKEIGIRKVLGASMAGIIGITTKQFLMLVGLANLVAWPVAYLIMNRWLSDFAYRINQDLSFFLLAAFFTVAVALLTVSVQAFRAASANPVNTLRSE